MSFNYELSKPSFVFIIGIRPFLNMKIRIQMLTILIELKNHPLKMDPRSLRTPVQEILSYSK